MAQKVKNLLAVQQTRVQSLGGEDLLEKGMATQSSILVWRIPGQRSLAGYSQTWLNDWACPGFCTGSLMLTGRVGRLIYQWLATSESWAPGCEVGTVLSASWGQGRVSHRVVSGSLARTRIGWIRTQRETGHQGNRVIKGRSEDGLLGTWEPAEIWSELEPTPSPCFAVLSSTGPSPDLLWIHTVCLFYCPTSS